MSQAVSRRFNSSGQNADINARTSSLSFGSHDHRPHSCLLGRLPCRSVLYHLECSSVYGVVSAIEMAKPQQLFDNGICHSMSIVFLEISAVNPSFRTSISSSWASIHLFERVGEVVLPSHLAGAGTLPLMPPPHALVGFRGVGWRGVLFAAVEDFASNIHQSPPPSVSSSYQNLGHPRGCYCMLPNTCFGAHKSAYIFFKAFFTAHTSLLIEFHFKLPPFEAGRARPL